MICKFETGWTEAKCFTEVNTELTRSLGLGLAEGKELPTLLLKVQVGD